METVKLISKQFSLKLRDILNSIFLGVGTPILLAIQERLESGHFDFSKSSLINLSMVAISAFLINILRKFTEKSKVVTIAPFRGGEPVPPPIGDPTHPKK